MRESQFQATDEEFAAAKEAQLRSVQYSHAMWITRQCEVCGSKDHPSYHCCELCNYDRHLCHFCGDNLGHDAVSACYYVIEIEEGLKTTPEMLREWIVKATHNDPATVLQDRTVDAVASLLATGKFEMEIAPGVTVKVEYP